VPCPRSPSNPTEKASTSFDDTKRVNFATSPTRHTAIHQSLGCFYAFRPTLTLFLRRQKKLLIERRHHAIERGKVSEQFHHGEQN
jgi:hypothetical protein